MAGLDITPQVPAGRQLIQSYGDDGFRIAGIWWSGAVVVRPEATEAWAPGEAVEARVRALLAGLSSDDPRPEIVVVGCGRRFAPPPPGLREAARAGGAALEWMDTAAACRTFNVLLIEGRRVAAGLLPLGARPPA